MYIKCLHVDNCIYYIGQIHNPKTTNPRGTLDLKKQQIKSAVFILKSSFVCRKYFSALFPTFSALLAVSTPKHAQLISLFLHFPYKFDSWTENCLRLKTTE